MIMDCVCRKIDYGGCKDARWRTRILRFHGCVIWEFCRGEKMVVVNRDLFFVFFMQIAMEAVQSRGGDVRRLN